MPSTRRLRVPGDVVERLRALHPELRRKVRGALDAIAAEPEVGKVLRDDLAGLRSLRVGKLRIVYRVAGALVEVLAVGPRSTIYEETSRLVERGKGAGPRGR